MSQHDTLVLYTDGVSETENERGEEFGVEQLSQLLSSLHSCRTAELVDACTQQVAAFRGTCERGDDETLLALQYAAAASGRVAIA